MIHSFKNIVCLLLTLCLFSCVSKEEQEGGSEIADLLGAEGVTISKGFESSTEKESIDYVGIEIINPRVLIDSHLTPLAVANLSALTLYKKLTAETIKEKNAIKVTIKVSNSNSDQEFTKVVLFTELKEGVRAIKTIEEFSQYLTDGKYEKAYELFGREVIETQAKDTTLQLMERVATAEGKISKTQVTNFGYTTVEHDGKKIQLMGVEGYYEKNKFINRFTYYVSVEDKIVGFNF